MNIRIFLIPVLLVAMNSHAKDMDDGIGIDTPVDDSVKTDVNINFIKRKALAKVRQGKQTNTCGVGNVTVGPGAKAPKEITIVGDFKGVTAVCGK